MRNHPYPSSGTLRRYAVAVVVLGVLLFSRMAEAAEQWIEVRSPHFTVMTDGGEKRGREVALRFEQMRGVFGILLHKPMNTSVPLQIVAFRGTKQFEQYMPIWKGKPVKLAGLYESATDKDFILLDLSAENPWETVYHEYAHAMLNANFPKSQPWFDEGIAEFFATLQVNSKEVELGRPSEWRVRVLHESPFIPLEKLFAVEHDSSTYNESGDRRSMFYSESWLLVHYLFDRKKTPQLDQYFDLVNNKGIGISEAVRRAFGEDIKMLDKDLEEYLRRNSAVLWKLEPPAKVDASTFTLKVLDEGESQAELADVHLHSRDHSVQAEQEFKKILEQNPKSGAAHRGLGYAMLQKRQLPDAREHFQQAAALESRDPYVYYYSAMLRNMEGRRGPADQEQTKQDLDKAIKLNPDFADAYALLGFAQANSQDYGAAAESMKKAVRLSPRNENYALNLGQFLLYSGNAKDGTAILKRLQGSSDATIARLASDTLDLAQRREEAMKAGASGGMPPRSIVEAPDDQSDLIEEKASGEKTEPGARSQGPGKPAEIKYLRGMLIDIECKQAGQAELRVQVGSKLVLLRVPDTAKVILLGEDKFSCSWKHRRVMINYREGEGGRQVISLELNP